MPIKDLAFFADFKRKVVKTHRHVYDYSAKIRVIFTQVRAYLLYLKTFEFVSFYTHFGMKFKQADCIFCLKLFLPNYPVF